MPIVLSGAVYRKPTSSSRESWVVRYRENVDGRNIQRSIYIGIDAAAADKARRLIWQWRRESLSVEEIRRAEMMKLHKLTIHSLNISKRAKQRLIRQAKDSLGNRMAELSFTMRLGAGQLDGSTGKKMGRPANSGLW